MTQPPAAAAAPAPLAGAAPAPAPAARAGAGQALAQPAPAASAAPVQARRRPVRSAARPGRPPRARAGARSTLVTIVVPAKDEEAAIGNTLRSLPLATLRALGFVAEVVVLDGNSVDRTPQIARAWGATVLPDRERGKGAALRHARGALRGELVVMLDADGTYAGDAIPRVLSLLASGEADIVMGDRRAQQGAMSGLHRVGNALLSLGASALYGRYCRDVCTGLWGFRADALRAMPLRSRGFELEAELFAVATRMGLRIAHTPVDYLPRPGGTGTKLSTGRDGLRIGWWLLRSRFAPLPVPAEAAA